MFAAVRASAVRLVAAAATTARPCTAGAARHAVGWHAFSTTTTRAGNDPSAAPTATQTLEELSARAEGEEVPVRHTPYLQVDPDLVEWANSVDPSRLRGEMVDLLFRLGVYRDTDNAGLPDGVTSTAAEQMEPDAYAALFHTQGAPEAEMEPESGLKRSLLRAVGYYGRGASALRAAHTAFHHMAVHCGHRGMLNECDMLVGPATDYRTYALHVWMLNWRTRLEGSEGNAFAHELSTFFWDDMLEKIRRSGVPELFAGKYMKEYQMRYWEHTALFDIGLWSEGDEKLARAVWWTLYNGGDVSMSALYRWVGYIRREVRALDRTPRDVVLAGKYEWGPLP